MSGNLFFTGLSGLNAARDALMTTAHNTANVYTPGYSRQVAEVATNGAIATGSGFMGTGVRVTTISRSFDAYLTAQLSSAQSSSAALSTYGTQINRIDTLLSDKTAGLSPLMQNFFTATQGVANTPSDPAARQQLISSAQALSNKFRSTDQYLTDLNSSVNDQIQGSVSQVNSFAKQIANLNQQIGLAQAMAGGSPPNDLMDQRDQLVSQLSQIVDVKVLAQADGQYSVSVGNGQSLVTGNQAATMQAVPSAADPTRTSIALLTVSGNVTQLNDNVITGGSLGGLMSFRAQSLIPAQNQIGQLAMSLSDAVNAQHKLGVDLNGALGGNFFTTATPGVFSNKNNTGTMVVAAAVTNTSQLTASDYSVDVKNVAGTLTYSVTRLSDKSTVATSTTFPITFDGVSLSSPSGAAQAGDSFLVQPTRTGARDMDVLVLDPAKVAAASPIITDNVAGNKGSGALSPATVDSTYPATPLAAPVTLAYDTATNSLTGFPAAASVTVTPPGGAPTTYAAGTAVPFTAGATMSFNGITVTLTGAPAQGDTFTIANNSGGVSDGSNALLIGGLQRKAVMGNGTTTFNDAYSQLVSQVGNRALEVKTAGTTQDSVTAQIKASQQSVSGVNQDEETGNLLMYQQMYQANAKVIQTASTIFDAILGINA